jgi:hypothetical protein
MSLPFHRVGGVVCLTQQLAQAREREEALLESAAVEDAYCLAEGHHHANRVEEAICSLRFQRDSLRLELEAERHNHTRDNAYLLDKEVAEKTRAKTAEGEVKRLQESNEGAYGCLKMVADTLTAIGCSHGPETRESTPPMMYPEWIMCCLRYQTKRLREAFNAAVRKPMGVVPTGYEGLYDAKEADDEAKG